MAAQMDKSAKIKLIVAVVALGVGVLLILDQMDIVPILPRGTPEVDMTNQPDPEQMNRAHEEQDKINQEEIQRGRASEGGA